MYAQSLGMDFTCAVTRTADYVAKVHKPSSAHGSVLGPSSPSSAPLTTAESSPPPAELVVGPLSSSASQVFFYNEYVEKKRDQGLDFHRFAGAQVVSVMPHWCPQDLAIKGHGVLICYDLAAPVHCQPRAYDVKQPFRGPQYNFWCCEGAPQQARAGGE